MVSLPISFIGVFILALGTTLPELIVQLKSSHSKEDGIFFGNVLGSVVVNSGLVLGLVSLISPIEVKFSKAFISPAVFTLIVFILLPIFLRSKKKLERKEGALLLAI
jgi:cation:H+ antiporter